MSSNSGSAPSATTVLLPWFDMAPSPPARLEPIRPTSAGGGAPQAPTRLVVSPPPAAPSAGAMPGSRPRVPPMQVDPESAITCLGCGALFQPNMTVHLTGPNRVMVQGEGYCPCCAGPTEPTVVRGREDVPESGEYLAVEPSDDEGDEGDEGT